MLCPRWDSNCIPAPANTGHPRKHTESGPTRPDPRPEMCTMYTPQIRRSESPNDNCTPIEGARFSVVLTGLGLLGPVHSSRASAYVAGKGRTTQRLSADEMRGDLPRAVLQRDVAGGHPHDEIERRIGAEVMPVAVDP